MLNKERLSVIDTLKEFVRYKPRSYLIYDRLRAVNITRGYARTIRKGASLRKEVEYEYLWATQHL